MSRRRFSSESMSSSAGSGLKSEDGNFVGYHNVGGNAGSGPSGVGMKRKDWGGSEAGDGDDEEAKRRRILERNRLAASKCRQKKKMWMQELEVKSAAMTAENRQIQNLVEKLKEEVIMLKNQLLLHNNCDCNVIQRYIATSNQFSESLHQSASSSHLHNEAPPIYQPKSSSAMAHHSAHSLRPIQKSMVSY